MVALAPLFWMALLTTSATPSAWADSDPKTCNLVGERDLQPGENILHQYLRLRSRAHAWELKAQAADRDYRAALFDSHGNVHAALEVVRTYEYYRDNCKEVLAGLERDNRVEYWESNSSVKYLTLSAAAELNAKKTLGFDEAKRSYVSDEVFEKSMKSDAPDRLDRFATYYASKNTLLTDCLLDLEEDASYRIDRHTDIVQCHDSWTTLERWESATIGYFSRRRGGVLEVSQRLSLFYSDSKWRKSAHARIEELRPCVEEFYARQGVRLKLTFNFDPNDPSFAKADGFVTLTLDSDRASQNEWSVFTLKGKPLTDPALCQTMAHEVGHFLRLDDAYAGDGCPLMNPPEGVPEKNLMNKANFASEASLEPWQVMRIAAPLCERWGG